MKLEQWFIDDLMAQAKALFDHAFQARLKQFEHALRTDCNWSAEEVQTWLHEAAQAYVGWREIELLKIEMDLFAARPDEQPEVPRVFQ